LEHDVNTPTPNSDADARVDAMARSAGRELRRPAPEHGLHQARRAMRHRRNAQIAGMSAVVVALVAVGGLALAGRDGTQTLDPPATDGSTTEVSVTVPPTTAPSATTVAPSIAPTTTTPTTATPATTAAAPPNGAAPEFVYTATGFGAVEQTLVDPVTGAVVRTEPLDGEVSQAAQEALTIDYGLFRSYGGGVQTMEAGGRSYELDRLSRETDIANQAPEALAAFDRCEQGGFRVGGGSATALPERAFDAAPSRDGRWVATLTTTCPEPGNLQEGLSEVPYAFTLTIFDTTQPQLEGRILADGFDPFSLAREFSAITFSRDGRFVAVQGISEQQVYRFFDTQTGAETDIDTGACRSFGTNWSRFVGPWIGESSIALQLNCGAGGTGASTLLVQDLAEPSSELRRDLGEAALVEVEYASYDQPGNVWFTVCGGFSPTTCRVGQGNQALIELPGAQQASFLPLGFSLGG
jgi:hypothetical protein